MHQIRFWLGLRPRPRWGVHITPRPLAGFQGVLLLREGRGGEKRRTVEGEEGKREGERRGGRKGEREER